MKRKKIVALLVSSLLALTMIGLTGCGEDESNTGANSSASSSEQEVTEVAEVTYDSIYDEYSEKIKTAGETAVSEYNDESAGVTDVNSLAELANEKVEDIAAVQVEGGEKMAELMYKNGDEYSVYQDAFNRLYEVYNDEAMKVYEAYMDQYADTIPGMTDEMKQQMLDSYEEGLESMAPIENKH